MWQRDDNIGNSSALPQPSAIDLHPIKDCSLQHPHKPETKNQEDGRLNEHILQLQMKTMNNKYHIIDWKQHPENDSHDINILPKSLAST
jgi:hypothetical protein